MNVKSAKKNHFGVEITNSECEARTIKIIEKIPIILSPIVSSGAITSIGMKTIAGFPLGDWIRCGHDFKRECSIVQVGRYGLILRDGDDLRDRD